MLKPMYIYSSICYEITSLYLYFNTRFIKIFAIMKSCFYVLWLLIHVSRRNPDYLFGNKPLWRLSVLMYINILILWCFHLIFWCRLLPEIMFQSGKCFGVGLAVRGTALTSSYTFYFWPRSFCGFCCMERTSSGPACSTAWHWECSFSVSCNTSMQTKTLGRKSLWYPEW